MASSTTGMFSLLMSLLFIAEANAYGSSLVRDEAELSFTGFGDATVTVANVYEFPTGAESWAGFANSQTGIYPVTLENEFSNITFTAEVSQSGDSVDLKFKFEYMEYPNTDPHFFTEVVTVSGDIANYTVAVPSQGANTYSSLLLYLVNRDVPVEITSIKLNRFLTVTYGCTNSTALNYDAAATDDDGSCVFVTDNFFTEGEWRLKGEANALCVGDQSPDYCNWWGNSADDVHIRKCLFDDRVVFYANGEMSNVHGSSTWWETWQGAPSERCGTFTTNASWDNNVPSWAWDQSTMELSTSYGYLGLLKIQTGSEAADTVGMESDRTYTVTPRISTYNCNGVDVASKEMTLTISPGGTGKWIFEYINVDCDESCTDANALNYNSLAVTDDGSCVYDLKVASPLTEVFGNAVIYPDGNIIFPSTADAWAGFKIGLTQGSYSPFTFQSDGYILFNAAVPSDVDVDLKFVFQRAPHPDVTPDYTTEIVTVSGSEAEDYSIAIPAQGLNTFTSFLVYLVDNDVNVTLTNIRVSETGEGCTDSSNENYVAAAAIDDGSCAASDEEESSASSGDDDDTTVIIVGVVVGVVAVVGVVVAVMMLKGSGGAVVSSETR